MAQFISYKVGQAQAEQTPYSSANIYHVAMSALS